jgi:hypothetical protein
LGRKTDAFDRHTYTIDRRGNANTRRTDTTNRWANANYDHADSYNYTGRLSNTRHRPNIITNA